jgi:hypothetical protein
MTFEKKLNVSLLLLRITVFLVIFIWTIDKFINPGHAAKVMEIFYSISGLGNTIVYAIGFVEITVLALFLIGYKKAWTYGAILALHSASTLSAFSRYLNPFEGNNLLFFAAWPMFAACLALWLLREKDTLLSVK